MQPPAIMERVCRAIEVLIEAGDRYGGLFPSMLDLKTHDMLMEMPPAIPGQRNTDRAPRGSNLIHDEAVLKTMVALDRPGFQDAADRYLRRFATHCTDTVSGLFPWGEHAFWDLVEDRPGNSYTVNNPDSSQGLTHDHLRAAPLWLWEKLHTFNPRCVERFGEGLDNHWSCRDPLEYIRPGYIDRIKPWLSKHSSYDFPRHSGFFIFDWAFRFAKSGRSEFLDQIQKMLDYWWEKRRDDGLLWSESRTTPGVHLDGVVAVGQTLFLAASLLEAATLLEGCRPALAAEMRYRASVYIRGFLNAPHDPDRGIFLYGFKPGTNLNEHASVIWGSVYGSCPVSYAALTCLCVYRITSEARLLDWAAAAGTRYVDEPFPGDAAVPAMDAGMGLGLLADLYDITGEDRWLDGGLCRAEELVSIYFGDCDLPRGAAGISWYESQMGPSFLLHGLARLALLADRPESCPLGADYTGR